MRLDGQVALRDAEFAMNLTLAPNLTLMEARWEVPDSGGEQRTVQGPQASLKSTRLGWCFLAHFLRLSHEWRKDALFLFIPPSLGQVLSSYAVLEPLNNFLSSSYPTSQEPPSHMYSPRPWPASLSQPAFSAYPLILWFSLSPCMCVYV